MDKKIAKKIALNELKKFKKMTFQQLVQCASNTETYEVFWEDDNYYTIQIHGIWDDPPKGNLKFFCEVSSGVWSSLFPHTEFMLIDPDEHLEKEETPKKQT